MNIKMEDSAEVDTRDCIKPNINSQYSHACNLQHSYTGRMVVVSDVDDDDASFSNAKHTVSLCDDTIVKIGSSSTTDSMVVEGAHRVTPVIEDSQEALARALPRDIPKVGRSNTVLPFCPTSFTDDRQTPFTIQPRKQDSQVKLVDKYAARAEKESMEHGDFNACHDRTLLKPEDTETAKQGIPRNLFDTNLAPNPISHKIADATPTSTTSLIQHSLSTINHPNQPQHQYIRKNLIKPQTHHKISFADDSNMPSKQTRCLPRQRSRAIAIKPSGLILPTESQANRVEDTNKEARQCDVELYDYATWRMYNRIIDHRRKNPLPVDAHQEGQQEQDQQQQFHGRMLKNTQTLRANQPNGHSVSSGASMAHGQRYFVRLPMYTDDDYVSGSEDEEIFDFEL